MGHAGLADELFEVPGDELRAVVADQAWPFAGELLASTLQDGFHVDFLHFVADFPVNDIATAAIKHRAEKVKGPGNVQVTDIDMPVLVRLQGLHEAGAFLGWLGILAGQEARVFEHAIDRGRAAGDHVLVEHHEGQLAIAFQGMSPGKGADAFLLITGEPVIARHPGVVFVDLAEAGLPVIELAGADAEPGQKASHGDLRLLAPGADEIDELIAAVMGDPAALQISPSSFFKSV